MAVLDNRPRLSVTVDNVRALRKQLMELVSKEVLVGFPEDASGRQAVLGEDITNAALGYIHDNGAPEANIPARPFMRPGMEDARDKVVPALKRVATTVLSKSPAPDAVDKGFTQVGLIVQASIRNKINEGIPPPLADSTLRDRARRGRKGAKQELANRSKGMPSSVDLAKPLVDTGQMRNAVTYVIRERKKRSL